MRIIFPTIGAHGIIPHYVTLAAGLQKIRISGIGRFSSRYDVKFILKKPLLIIFRL